MYREKKSFFPHSTSHLLNACVYDFMDLEMSLMEEKSLENVKVTGV